MKKLHLLLSAALLAAITTQAQSTALKTLLATTNGNKAHHTHGTAAKTTATGSRLIKATGVSNDGANYVPTDSIAISWSGTNGGDINTGLVKFSNYVEYVYNSTTLSYTNAIQAAQTFDANDNVTATLEQEWIASSSSYRNYYKISNTFDASNNMLTSVDQNWDTTGSVWVNSDNYIYTYDGNHNILTEIYQSWSGSAWVNSDKYIYTYDASNNNLTYIQQSWDAGTSTWTNDYNDINTYTGANKLDINIHQLWMSGAWVNGDRLINTYDASNNLTDALHEYWDGGSSVWHNDYQNVYTFDGSNDQLTNLQQTWDDGSSAWVNGSNTIYSSFVATLPQLEVYTTWNSTTLIFDNANETMLTYNGHNQLTSTYTSTWNAGGFFQPVSGDQGARYYYEDYTTSVSNVSNNNCTASVYPVPTKDQLHVSITWNEPQAFSIEIMDMSGRIVNTRQMPVCTSYDGNITLGNLPEGNYIMKMTGTSAQSVQQIVIAK